MIGVLVKRDGYLKPAMRTMKGELRAIDPLGRVRVCDGESAVCMPAREFEQFVNDPGTWAQSIVPLMEAEGNVVNMEARH